MSSQPSNTALLILRCFALLACSSKLSELVPDPEKTWLAAPQNFRKVAPLWLRLLIANKLFNALLLKLSDFLTPGIIPHYAGRKKLIRSITEQFFTENPSAQLLMLGGGFDLSAVYLKSRYPKGICREGDLSFTQEAKKELFGDLLREIDLFEVDLKDPETLADQTKHSLDTPLVMLCEGVTMYLTSDEVKALLSTIGEIAIRPLRLIFTFMEPDQEGRIQFRGQSTIVGRWLASKKEPFKSGFKRESLHQILQSCGFSSVKFFEHNNIAPLLPPGLLVAQGEVIAVADH